jgi:hypothetical protein
MGLEGCCKIGGGRVLGVHVEAIACVVEVGCGRGWRTDCLPTQKLPVISIPSRTQTQRSYDYESTNKFIRHCESDSVLICGFP